MLGAFGRELELKVPLLPGREARCMDRALLILLLPLFRAITGWAMSPGLLCWALAGGPEHLGKVPACPVGVEGDIGHGSHWHLYAQQSLLFSELPCSPPRRLYTVSLVCFIESDLV